MKLKFECLMTCNMSGVTSIEAVNFMQNIQRICNQYHVEDYRIDDCSSEVEQDCNCEILEGNTYVVCDKCTLQMFSDLLLLADKYKVKITEAALYSV